MLLDSAKDPLLFSVIHFKHPKQPHTVQVNVNSRGCRSLLTLNDSIKRPGVSPHHDVTGLNSFIR